MTNDVDTFNTIAGWPMARLVEHAKRGEKEAAQVALEVVRRWERRQQRREKRQQRVAA
jgi:hypothetical protein